MKHDQNDTAKNRIAWDAANYRANLFKGDYSETIRSGEALLPTMITDKISSGPTSRVLHIFCNDGREAAYLAYAKGCRVCGVDFSRPAISFAKALNNSLCLQNEFIEAEAQNWMELQVANSFDYALITLGSLWWIPDLSEFFSALKRLVSQNGLVILWDFHPITTCFDNKMVIYRSYPFERTVLTHERGIEPYVDDPENFRLAARIQPPSIPDRISHPVLDYRWSFAEIIECLLRDRMFALESIKELDFVWEERYFPWLVERMPREYSTRQGEPSIPLSFMVAVKKA